MELDKKIRAMLDAQWERFLKEFQHSILMQDPLKAALAMTKEMRA